MRLGRASTVTNAQREELWRRYKAGETILGIGRALDQRHSRSRVGSEISIPGTRRCGCHTRRSTAAFSSRLAVP
jgi:hypothetical protein